MKALNKNEMRNINGGYDVKCKYCGRTFKDKTYGLSVDGSYFIRIACYLQWPVVWCFFIL